LDTSRSLAKNRRPPGARGLGFNVRGSLIPEADPDADRDQAKFWYKQWLDEGQPEVARRSTGSFADTSGF